MTVFLLLTLGLGMDNIFMSNFKPTNAILISNLDLYVRSNLGVRRIYSNSGVRPDRDKSLHYVFNVKD